MKNRKLFSFVVSTLLVAAFVGGCTKDTGIVSTKKSVSEEELGLRKVTLYNENSNLLKTYEYGKDAPGTSKVIERSFENAPPMISHDIEGMEPITRDNNACTSCHLPEVAKDVGATPMPKSHFYDMRTAKDNQGVMEDARYNCTQCHAPQANLDPLVKNTFSPNFRKDTAKGRSNLLDNLNEGVR